MKRPSKTDRSLPNRSIEKVSEQIRALERLDRRITSYSQIRAQVDSIFNGYSCLTRRVQCDRAWRARKNVGNSLFSSVQELWYPPPEYIPNFGRMNEPRQSMFYIAASHQTAVLEMRAKPGDLVTVMELGLLDGTRLPHVMEIGVAEKASQYKLPSTVNLLENTQLGREFLGDDTEHNLRVRSFLAKEVMRIVGPEDSHLFKVSAAIGARLTSSDRIDGVEYPCIAGDGSGSKGGVNLAIKPCSADRLFKPTSCFVVRALQEVPAAVPSLLVKCINTASRIHPDGTISWNNPAS